MPEISVIIPIYNSSSTLRSCLDSVLSQTFSDWEALCVYDESVDESKKILEEYCAKDGRFVFVQGRNRLLAGARNDGLRKACGNYVCFLDADDILRENAFGKIREEFERRRCDIVVFGTDIAPENPPPSEWYRWVLYTRSRFYPRFSRKALFAEPCARPFVWRDAFTWNFLGRCGVLFDEGCSVGEDQVFQLCAFPHAENGISFISDRLYEYTWKREGSLMSEYGKDDIFRLGGHIKMCDAVFRYWEERGYDRLSKKYIAVWATDFLSDEIPSLPSEKRDALFPAVSELFGKWFPTDFLDGLPRFAKRKAKILLGKKNIRLSRLRHRLDVLNREWYWGGFFMTGKFLLKKSLLALSGGVKNV